MADGKLVKMLLHTKVTKYLEWKCVDASYVVQQQAAGWLTAAKLAVCKVPANDTEALKSPLMGMFEKKRVAGLYKYVMKVNPQEKETWGDMNLQTSSMKDLFEKHQLEENTIDFLGHSVCLHYNDFYLYEPAIDTVEKMQLYMRSQGRYGDSPFLYPIYGLGGLPEAFSRLCAIHGGTYMLNQDAEEITYDADGKVTGIKCGDQTASAPLIICDPSYAGDKNLKPTNQIIRAICIMNHPIPDTNNASSVQVIIPAR